MQFFPQGWWNLDVPHATAVMWERAPAATPWFIILSLTALVISMWGRTIGFSGFAIIGHFCIAIGQLLWVPDILRRWYESGAPNLYDAPILHAIWINLLFAWLHWLHISRFSPDDPPPPKPKNETGSV